jgi:flagellar biogenesis protein FliO
VTPGELTTEMVRMVGAFSLIVAGIVSLAVIARRFLPLLGQRYQPASPLKHLGTLVLTPQCSVALVQAGQEMIVLGLTPQQVTLLTKARKDEEAGGESLQLTVDSEERAENRKLKTVNRERSAVR